MSGPTGQNIDPKLRSELWAKYTVERFLKAMVKLRVGKTGALSRSFVHHVQSSAGGDLQKIRLAYLYYGMFVDMGVGRGVKIDDVKENMIRKRQEDGAFTRRRPKKWYSKTLETEVFKLGRILAQEYGIKAFDGIIEGVPRRVVLPM